MTIGSAIAFCGLLAFTAFVVGLLHDEYNARRSYSWLEKQNRERETS